ncbi:MAG: hypothetical protein N3C59_06900 [Azovibrio sp.]|nr:hypothetical protein [Azovibrio sp.]
MLHFARFSYCDTSRPRAWRLLGVGALASAVLPVQAGRPLATDDAAIVTAGACQIEAWHEQTRAAHGVWLNSGCTPASRTEFAVGAGQLYARGTAAVAARQWQVKHLLSAEEGEWPSLAIALGGVRIRDTPERQRFIKAIASLPLAGEAHLVHVNLGALRAADAAGRRWHATWSAAWDAAFRPLTRASFESFGSSGERPHWQVGVRHAWAPGRIQIDASVGSPYGRWHAERMATFGLVFVGPVLGH